MNWFQRTCQEYEFQPIGAPFRRKVEMPPAVHRNNPSAGLRPSPFDVPFSKDIHSEYPEIARQQQSKEDHVEGQLSILRESLTRHLADSLREYPERYSYEESDIPTVVERFLKAMQTGQFHTSSEAFRRMCKEFGIKPTEKGIAKFIFPENTKQRGRS